jgi:hypothetical protein
MNTRPSINVGRLLLPAWNALCLRLCQRRCGRALLHLTALLRNPRNLKWHWAGIRRECSRHTRSEATVTCQHTVGRATAHRRHTRNGRCDRLRHDESGENQNSLPAPWPAQNTKGRL